MLRNRTRIWLKLAVFTGVTLSAPMFGRDAYAGGSSDWLLTVYYTAVESFHSGPTAKVYGCPTINCVNATPKMLLGEHSQSFVTAVKDEGSGRITEGKHAGMYLNWSVDVGYWLDTVPRDHRGKPLIPFVSAAADADVLQFDTTFDLVDCGRTPEGGQIDVSVCEALQNGNWVLVDRFSPGLGGGKHLDLYIGEEDQEDFKNSKRFISTKGAEILINDASRDPRSARPNNAAGRGRLFEPGLVATMSPLACGQLPKLVSGLAYGFVPLLGINRSDRWRVGRHQRWPRPRGRRWDVRFLC